MFSHTLLTQAKKNWIVALMVSLLLRLLLHVWTISKNYFTSLLLKLIPPWVLFLLLRLLVCQHQQLKRDYTAPQWLMVLLLPFYHRETCKQRKQFYYYYTFRNCPFMYFFVGRVIVSPHNSAASTRFPIIIHYFPILAKPQSPHNSYHIITTQIDPQIE